MLLLPLGLLNNRGLSLHNHFLIRWSVNCLIFQGDPGDRGPVGEKVRVLILSFIRRYYERKDTGKIPNSPPNIFIKLQVLIFHTAFRENLSGFFLFKKKNKVASIIADKSGLCQNY